MSSDKNAGPWVYFIQAGENGPIKIGWTGGNPLSRLAALQTGNHEPLKLIAWSRGTLEDEAKLHEVFAAHRLTGEWFAPVGALLALVWAVQSACAGAAPLPAPLAVEGFTEDQIAFTQGMIGAALVARDLRFVCDTGGVWSGEQADRAGDIACHVVDRAVEALKMIRGYQAGGGAALAGFTGALGDDLRRALEIFTAVVRRYYVDLPSRARALS